VRLYEGRILIGQIVDAVGLHKTGDSVGGADHRIPGPDGVPPRLPCKSDPGLEVSDSLVRVVSKPYLGLTGDQIEVHVLPIVGAARCDLLPAQSKV
jgi:hypothetical protein